ncbi:MAG: N-acetylglucosamine-6-phosphate deacetylase [Sulfobacillus benefaciens]|uniref:N-acetylglucosamine-6-phosphate deacetylase n=1 Tax=Sulfobacillus benefaciens TaxID=453960 RepID=A0A2T2XAK1_9FIRM|nr:MAG: N-acetylglucosamine-6-phosphate deacetylase [Sulfobacillus benefaciens]
MIPRNITRNENAVEGRVYLSATGNPEPARVQWNRMGKIERIVRLDTRANDLPLILPGFIDEHVHGAQGHDVMEANIESWSTIGQALAKHGVTSFLATTLSASEPELQQVMECAQNYPEHPQNNLIGLHWEGPYIDPAFKGAQPLEAIRGVDMKEIQSLMREKSGVAVPVRLVTLAPNLPRSMPLIDWLVERGIRVNLGHSGAEREETIDAVKHGADGITHLFNGMAGLHHRHPGMVGTALTEEALWLELITDGIHIHPDVVRLVFHVAASRVILVTDGISATDCSPGKHKLGKWLVNVDEGSAHLEDGTLAGSILSTDQSLRNLLQWGVPLRQIVYSWSEAPARRFGLTEHGRIEPGYYADLVELDSEYRVLGTLKHGQWIYEKE